MAKTILVVDDSASLRSVVRMALTGAGFEVIEAGDGQAALDKLDGRPIALAIPHLARLIIKATPSRQMLPASRMTARC